jgi:hypothetical protein
MIQQLKLSSEMPDGERRAPSTAFPMPVKFAPLASDLV